MAITLPPDTLAAHPEWDHILNGSQGQSYATPPANAGDWLPGAPMPSMGGWMGNASQQSSGGLGGMAGQTASSLGTAAGSSAPPGLGTWAGQGASIGGNPWDDMRLPTVPPFDQFGNPNPAYTEWNARNALRGAQGARNAAEQAYLNMRLQREGPAEQALLAARSRHLAAQSSYLEEQGRFLSQQQAEQASLYAARNNVQDLQNVAAGERLRESQTYRYRLAGLNAPIEVTMPPGYSGPMPLGTVAKIQTLAQQLETIYKNADDLEKFRVEAARIHSEQIGQEVTAADIARGSVALSLQEAELAVRQAGLQETQAQQNLQFANQPPAPGLVPYTSPDDGTFQWVTESQLRELQRIDTRNRNLQTAGELGIQGLSISQLLSYASEVNADGTPVLSEQQLLDILNQRGTPPADVQIFVNHYRYLQSQHHNNPFGLGIGGAAPPAGSIPYDPTAPSGGFPSFPWNI